MIGKHVDTDQEYAVKLVKSMGAIYSIGTSSSQAPKPVII